MIFSNNCNEKYEKANNDNLPNLAEIITKLENHPFPNNNLIKILNKYSNFSEITLESKKQIRKAIKNCYKNPIKKNKNLQKFSKILQNNVLVSLALLFSENNLFLSILRDIDISIADRGTGKLIYNKKEISLTNLIYEELCDLDELVTILFVAAKENKKITNFIGHDNYPFNENFSVFMQEKFRFSFPFQEAKQLNLTNNNQEKQYILKTLEDRYLERSYNSFIVEELDGKQFVFIDEIKYQKNENDNRYIVYSQNNKKVYKYIKFAIFGQRMLKNGKNNIKNCLENDEIQDLRHLFALPMISDSIQEEIYKINNLIPLKNGSNYFGLHQLLQNKEKRNKSFDSPVEIKANFYDGRTKEGLKIIQNLLDKILTNSNKAFGFEYETVNSEKDVLKRGQYYYNVETRIVTIFFKFNVYPHNGVMVDLNNNFYLFSFGGLSGRAGFSFSDIIEILQEKGATDVLIFSNGGSSRLYDYYSKEKYPIVSSEKRRFNSILLMLGTKFEGEIDKRNYFFNVFDDLIQFRIKDKEEIEKDKKLDSKHLKRLKELVDYGRYFFSEELSFLVMRYLEQFIELKCVELI